MRERITELLLEAFGDDLIVRDFAKEVEGGYYYVIPYRHQDRIIGLCAIPNEGLITGSHEVFGVCIEEALRGMGYGEAMMRYAIDHMKVMGAKTITLYCDSIRQKNFYEKLGFRVINNQCDDYQMQLKIENANTRSEQIQTRADA